MRLAVRLIVAFVICAAIRPAVAGPRTSTPVTTLTVPFLPQTESLCGGAAAAMMFRFWGERHADVQQFAPIVDRKAGGIEVTALVRAIEQRGWHTQRLDGTLADLKALVESARPPIVLIEDRPKRYHFVVVVFADDEQVIVHDPAWGPSRRYKTPAFLQAWAPTHYWTLVVTPDDALAATEALPATPTGRRTEPSACDRAVDEAVAVVRAQGFAAADATLGAVQAKCPQSSRPLSELAGIRLAQHRYSEAAALAHRATAVDPSDAYAWDVLGSSRFVQDDVPAALKAWNVIQRPVLDSVSIEGLEHTQYARVAVSLPLEPNRVIGAGDFAMAARRLAEQPAFLGSRVGLTPIGEGWAVADIAVLERSAAPRGWMQWSAAGVSTMVSREVQVDLPGRSGQGELWSARWRWWQSRPYAALTFAAPAMKRLSGIWTVQTSWMAQQYSPATSAPQTRETRSRGSLTRTDWATPQLRYELSSSLDVWDGSRRAASLAASLERRFASDRISLSASGRHWWELNDGAGFTWASSQAAVRSSMQDRGFVAAATLGASAVTVSSPLSEWPGAGDVDSQSPLLRAHPLTSDGVVSSKAFGRRLAFASFEERRWFEAPLVLRVGVAVFVDAAQAWSGPGGSAKPLLVDAGAGVRIRLPGERSILRVDFGRGLRDPANALTIGWQR